jgi:hypothetical protein
MSANEVVWPTGMSGQDPAARAGRAALWVHVPDNADADRAVRRLADHQVLHFRHYGHDRQQDLHVG